MAVDMSNVNIAQLIVEKLKEGFGDLKVVPSKMPSMDRMGVTTWYDPGEAARAPFQAMRVQVIRDVEIKNFHNRGELDLSNSFIITVMPDPSVPLPLFAADVDVHKGKYGFARGENQNRVLCALRDKLASPSVIKEIPDLIELFRDNVQTDMAPAQITQLACIGAQIEAGDIRFADFPEDLFIATREYDPVFGKNISIVKADFNILRDYVTQFHAGNGLLNQARLKQRERKYPSAHESDPTS